MHIVPVASILVFTGGPHAAETIRAGDVEPARLSRLLVMHYEHKIKTVQHVKDGFATSVVGVVRPHIQ